MKRRFSQDTIVLLVLLFLLIVVSILASRREPSDGGGLSFSSTRTTYSSSPPGVKALYETLRRLNYPVTRQLAPLTSSPGPGVLFMLGHGNVVPVSKYEWASIEKWVSSGNLLVTDSAEYHSHAPGEQTQENTYKYVPGEQPRTETAHPVCPSFLSGNVRAIAVPSGASVTDNEWKFQSESPVSPLHAGHFKRKVQRSQSYPLVALFGSESKLAASFAKCGKGGVLVLCEAWPLTNEGLAAKDNLTFVLNTLAYGDKGKDFAITFDEYHHGYGGAPGITSLLGTPARLGLGQLFLAFLLLVLAVSRSFGRPIPLREGSRPRSEYLYSMSLLLQRARAFDIVTKELNARFIEDTSRYFGLPPSTDADTLIQAAKRRSPEMETKLRELLYPGRREGTSEASILSLEARRDQFRKELRRK
jgi:hypothetical protein